MPACIGPVLAVRISAGLYEVLELAVGHRVYVDPERRHLDSVPATFVVVRRSTVVRTDLDQPARKAGHPGRSWYRPIGWDVIAQGRRVRLTLLELECLENGLVVLVLVLEHHLVDVTILEQWIGRIEVGDGQTTEHPPPDLVHDLATVSQRREGQR